MSNLNKKNFVGCLKNACELFENRSSVRRSLLDLIKLIESDTPVPKNFANNVIYDLFGFEVVQNRVDGNLVNAVRRFTPNNERLGRLFNGWNIGIRLPIPGFIPKPEEQQAGVDQPGFGPINIFPGGPIDQLINLIDPVIPIRPVRVIIDNPQIPKVYWYGYLTQKCFLTGNPEGPILYEKSQEDGTQNIGKVYLLEDGTCVKITGLDGQGPWFQASNDPNDYTDRFMTSGMDINTYPFTNLPPLIQQRLTQLGVQMPYVGFSSASGCDDPICNNYPTPTPTPTVTPTPSITPSMTVTPSVSIAVTPTPSTTLPCNTCENQSNTYYLSEDSFNAWSVSNAGCNADYANTPPDTSACGTTIWDRSFIKSSSDSCLWRIGDGNHRLMTFGSCPGEIIPEPTEAIFCVYGYIQQIGLCDYRLYMLDADAYDVPNYFVYEKSSGSTPAGVYTLDGTGAPLSLEIV